jgi:ribonuclease I
MTASATSTLLLFVALILYCHDVAGTSTKQTCVSSHFNLAYITIAQTGKVGDIYVLAYSWQPQFCYGQTSYPGCLSPQDYWKTHFTLHGLWPQYEAGGYPQTCSTEPFDPSIPLSIGWSIMTQYWPNVKSAETAPD